MIYLFDSGPLGIHVVPCNDDGRLVVQGIEPGGRVDRDGRLAVGDEIVEINGFPLTNVQFTKAQEIFKEALLHKDLVLQVCTNITLGCVHLICGCEARGHTTYGPSFSPSFSEVMEP